MLDAPFDFFALLIAIVALCLGLVLVAIGWLYQKILFRRQIPPLPATSTGP